MNKKLGNKSILAEIKGKIWDWAGHANRFRDNRWSGEISSWTPYSKRKKGRQKARWRDPITKFLNNNFFERIMQDRTEWSRLREAFAHNVGL